MYLPLTLLIILIISLIFIVLANKLHFSEAIGLIVVGLLMSHPFLKNNVIAGHEEFIGSMSNIGLFTLMFVSGFEVSGNMMAKEKKDSLLLTISTVLTSFIFGFIILKLLGFNTDSALIMGICFGITAEATKAKVFLELGKMKTRIGSLLMGTGIINDIFGVFALVAVVYFFTGKFSFEEVWILGGLLLSFGLGMVIHIFFDRYSKEIKIIEKIIVYLVVPFFFVHMGFNFNFEIKSDYKIFLLVFLTAAVGQLLGTFIVSKKINLNLKQTFLVGWGMNSKGAVELAIAFVALQVGILNKGLYSALIFTALISTVLFQVIIFRMIKKYPDIMD